MGTSSIGKEVVVELEEHGRGKIYIDNCEIENVHDIEIIAGVNKHTIVTLKLIGIKVKLKAKEAGIFCNTTSIGDDWQKSDLPEFENK